MTPPPARRIVTPASGRSAVAERGSAAALAVSGVAKLHGGPGGSVTTYRPSGAVPGIRLLPHSGARVCLVAEFGTALVKVAEQVRVAVGAHTGFPVDVTISDITNKARDAERSVGTDAGSEDHEEPQ